MPRASTPDVGDAQAQAEERFAEIQAEMERPAPPHVRNINYDTHVGFAPQRPHARLEDELGSLMHGAGSFEQLAASLPEGEHIEQDDRGEWVRYVPQTVGQVRDASGAVFNEVEDVARYVALTQEQAKAASQGGRETDWWNGFTWFRRGYKPEKTILLVGAPAPQTRKRRLERADDATQANMDRDALLRVAAAPVIPRAAAADAEKGK